MRMVFGLVLVLGMALAGFAVYMARNIMNQNAAELAAARAQIHVVPTVGVFVAKKKLAYGDVLTKDDVMTIAWPKDAVPAAAFTDPKKLFPDGADKSRTVMREIDKFEPLMTAAITEPGEDAGLTSRLAAGMRAFAIRVDVATGVSGFLRPGDHVDVYWTGTNPVDHSDITKMIQPNVEVIAIDQNANSAAQATAAIARTVTVQASPEVIGVLAQAQATGHLALSLVGAHDTTTAKAVEMDQNRLLGITAAAPVEAAPQKKVCTVKQRNGATVVDIPVPCPDSTGG